MAPEDGFHRRVPACIHRDTLCQTARRRQRLRGDPAAHLLIALPQRGLLQRTQRGEAATLLAQFATQFIEIAAPGVDVTAPCFDPRPRLLGALLPAPVDIFELQHPRLAGFALRLKRRCIEIAEFPGQLLDALSGLRHRFLELPDPGLLHTHLLSRRFGRHIEGIPLGLQALHGLLCCLQRRLHLLVLCLCGLKCRHHLLVLCLLAPQQGLVAAQVFLCFAVAAAGLFQIEFELPSALRLHLHGLLCTGDLRTHRVIALLDRRLYGGKLLVALAGFLDGGLDVGVPCVHLGECDLPVEDGHTESLGFGVQRLPSKREQLGAQETLLGLQFAVALGRACLPLEVLELALELLAQIGETFEVLARAADAVLGVAAPVLVTRDACGFLDVDAEILGFRLDQAGNHPLLDDRVTARAEPRTEEDVRDVTPTATRTVQVVVRDAVAAHGTADTDLGVARVFAAQRPVGVVENEFYGGLPERLAAGGTVEDDVGHRFATQVLGGALPENPAHRIDDVRFAATVGADNRAEVARQLDRRRIDEGLEAGQLYGFQSHRESARRGLPAASGAPPTDP